MLGKIFKYDLKATARMFLPMYLIFTIITIVHKISLELVIANNNYSSIISSIRSLFSAIYFIAIIAIFITTIIFTVTHFYKTLIGHQGYLTFTLPVKAATHLNSKILLHIFWMLCTIIITAGSIFFMAIGHLETWIIREVFNIMYQELALYELTGKVTLLFILMAIGIIIGLLESVTMIFASITLGQKFGKNRILGSVISYIVLYIINQAISVILIIITGLFRIGDFINNNLQLLSFINNFMLLVVLFSTATTIAYYLVTRHLLKNRLNLE